MNQHPNLDQGDVNFLEKHFSGDAELLQEVLHSYKKTCIVSVLNARKSLSANDPILLANSIHKLKGSTLNFVKNSFTQRLEEIESDARKENRIVLSETELNEVEVYLQQLVLVLSSVVTKWRSRHQPLFSV